MSSLNTFVNAIYSYRLRQIENFVTNPIEVQEKQFLALINSARYTKWGKKYDYNTIRNIDDYRKRVPLFKYEDLCNHIERVKKGENNLIWPSKIKWFAKSSGTTNDKSKYIPVSEESLNACHYQGGKDVVALYLRNNPDSKILTGKTLTLGGSYITEQNGIETGDLSAIMIKNLPFYVNLVRTPFANVALIPKWEEKLEKICKVTLKQNVRAIAGVPSWNLVMINYLLEFTGKKNLLEIWPGLELFIHGGVSFGPYREQYEKIIPSPNMHYMETYNASEGFFAIQDDPSNSSMQIMLDYGIFYEFIPMDQIESENPATHHIGEVQPGINYAMVISTNGGLWRYIIGDTVMFTSVFPHKLMITGRTKHFINAFGEEVIIDNAEKALQAACKETGGIIHEYTAAPVFMENNIKPHHEWFIEFAKEPDDLNKFIYVLDSTLMSINSDYEAKRYKNITLDTPKLVVLKKGTFYKWFSEKGKLGGQNKMPRLSNSRQYVEDLKRLDALE
jgi:hypothetical protein